jgi:hypothetical protein
MSGYFNLEAKFSYEAEPHDQLEMFDLLDNVVDHLYELGAHDVNVVADGEGTFTLSLAVDNRPGEIIETVIGRGMGTVRAAFHACEASTPNWPKINEMLDSVSLTSAKAVHAERRLTAV